MIAAGSTALRVRIFAAIAFLLLTSESGCVVVPVPQDHVNGRAVTSDPLMLKPNVTTEEEVLLRLGDPDSIWSDRVFVYTWDHVHWAILWAVGTEGGGTGGMFDVTPAHQMLIVQFDDTGHVKRAERTEVPPDTKLQVFMQNWTNGSKANAGS